jgi:hypothetical protein
VSKDIDLTLLSKMLGMTGSSGDGEALNAARLANKLVVQSGRSWADFVEAYKQAETATEAASVLLAENTSLKAELAELRSTGSAVAPWQNIGAQVSSTRDGAQWALALHAQGAVWLSDFEVQFLTRCSTWTGRLTAKMQPIYTRVIDRITERTGLVPP